MKTKKGVGKMNRRSKGKVQTIYSTKYGRLCPECGKPIARCECKSKRLREDLGDGVVRIRREVQGRKGKTVTIISGLPLEPDALTDLARKLKRKCGTGGTVKNGTILIQGDHCEKLLALVRESGFAVKKAGG